MKTHSLMGSRECVVFYLLITTVKTIIKANAMIVVIIHAFLLFPISYEIIQKLAFFVNAFLTIFKDAYYIKHPFFNFPLCFF